VITVAPNWLTSTVGGIGTTGPEAHAAKNKGDRSAAGIHECFIDDRFSKEGR
jgi:hypothetical protein